MPDLHELLARVEGSTGDDHELAAAIIEATNPHKSGPYASWQAAMRAFGWDTRVTSSLDAAVALIERVLPGESFVLRKSSPTYWMRDGVPAGQWGFMFDSEPRGWTVAASAPLAVLAALLRALIAQEQKESAG